MKNAKLAETEMCTVRSNSFIVRNNPILCEMIELLCAPIKLLGALIQRYDTNFVLSCALTNY